MKQRPSIFCILLLTFSIAALADDPVVNQLTLSNSSSVDVQVQCPSSSITLAAGSGSTSPTIINITDFNTTYLGGSYSGNCALSVQNADQTTTVVQNLFFSVNSNTHSMAVQPFPGDNNTTIQFTYSPCQACGTSNLTIGLQDYQPPS